MDLFIALFGLEFQFYFKMKSTFLQTAHIFIYKLVLWKWSNIFYLVIPKSCIYI